MARHILICLFVIIAIAPAAAAGTFRGGHVVVEYQGVDEAHAKAFAGVLDAARDAAVKRYGFDLPEQIIVTVHCAPGNRLQLFTDGQDRITSNLRSLADLRQPSKSGIFTLYGLCHELGHLTMYRPIARHDWLTGDAAEAWAHHIGSHLTDAVYEAEGESVWFEPYDYRADGLGRLKTQLESSRKDSFIEAARLWDELVRIIGEKQIAPLFAAWGEANIDPHDPAAALRDATKTISDDPRLGDWWTRAEPVLLSKRSRSGFEARTLKPAELSGQPIELALDDGKPAGKLSSAGGGHAVSFDAPAEGWALTSIRIYGSRYGTPQPPREDFSVFLVDADDNTIHEFSFPYSSFARGDEKWVTLKTAPTTVPRQFKLIAAFNPTGTKGVYVHHDGSADHAPQTGLPGRLGDFDRGDWLIRATLDQPKTADALRPR